MSAKFDDFLKLMLLGDAGVGKSAILTQYTDDKFHEGYEPTIGEL